MKRVLSMMIVMIMVLGLTCTVFAAESEFVPSITEKPAPGFLVDDEGYIAVIKDAEGNVVSYVPAGHLVITSVADADTSNEIPEAARALLLSVYQQLLDGTMVLPAEKLNEKFSPAELTVRDLFDLTWVCDEATPTHEELLNVEGNVLEITLSTKIAADIELYCMTYKNEEWNPIVSMTNNGDGTVTCVFAHLCPVAFILAEDKDVPDTGSLFGSDLFLWVGVMVVSATALVLVVANNRKKQA